MKSHQGEKSRTIQSKIKYFIATDILKTNAIFIAVLLSNIVIPFINMAMLFDSFALDIFETCDTL